jgi:hypothetical protein
MVQATTGLTLFKPGFNPRPVNVGFVVVKVAQGQFSEHFGFAISIIPLVFHAHSFIYHQHYITSVIDSIIK